MNTAVMRLLSAALIVSLLGCDLARADADAIILPTDPRFNVFELSNSAGDSTFSGPLGVVVLSFASKDRRYCRAARFPADQTFVLACREELGWKIEATSNLAADEARNPTNFGGGPMREVGEAVEALRAGVDFLDEREIIEAAARGWRDPAPLDEQALEARDILRRTARIYRASKSYVDTGTVQTVYSIKSGERTGETRFKTAYVAPFDFRFESTMNDFVYFDVGFIAWRDRDGVDVWLSSSPDIIEYVNSIQDALDAGAGISRDSSGMIPGLIFPGTKLGGDIVRLTDAIRIEDAPIDGFDCFQVQGFRWPNTGESTTVWIDKATFLIRKVYEEGKIPGGTTRTTWFYKPAINVPVDAASLRFNKPRPRSN